MAKEYIEREALLDALYAEGTKTTARGLAILNHFPAADVFGDILPTKEELKELADDLRRMAFSAEDSFVYETSDKAADLIEKLIN